MGFVARFLLAVILVGWAEVFLLVEVARDLGLLATAGLCVLTGVIGGALVRIQGLRTLWEIERAVAAGRPPAVEIVSGVVLLVVGALLVTPGFLTDAAGFLLLVPALRRRAARVALRAISRRISVTRVFAPGEGAPPAGPARVEVIDVTPRPGDAGAPPRVEVVDVTPEGGRARPAGGGEGSSSK